MIRSFKAPIKHVVTVMMNMYFLKLPNVLILLQKLRICIFSAPSLRYKKEAQRQTLNLFYIINH